jgi:hypothetical protein
MTFSIKTISPDAKTVLFLSSSRWTHTKPNATDAIFNNLAEARIWYARFRRIYHKKTVVNICVIT